MITIKVLRFNPEKDKEPYFESYEIEETNIGSLTDCDNFSLPVNINLYSNALLQLADPILSILLSIPRQKDPKDVSIFRLQLLDLLKDFKRRSITTDYHPSVIEKSTYILCAALDEAIAHINHYSTKHSEAIVSENKEAFEKFFTLVDSSCLYLNASTRFTDGGEFGCGAEIGISTSKMHARGPMGLKEITTYKYKICGNGQIRK